MEDNRIHNVQDVFLNDIRKAGLTVSIYVTNGYLIKNAKVLSFDNYSILVEVKGVKTLVYKHAVSTIMPDPDQEPIRSHNEN